MKAVEFTDCTDSVSLIRGDCYEMLSSIKADALVTDPPYGMNWNTDSRRFTGGMRRQGAGCDSPRIIGDTAPFNPLLFLGYPKIVLFGANHFWQALPKGTTLVWIKKKTFGNFLSDAEIAWQKGGHGVYCFEDVSMHRKGIDIPNYHPTLKPVTVMKWILRRLKLSPQAVVFDPFMGSGTTGIAALDLGFRFVGIEIDADYYAVAKKRLIDERVDQMKLFDETDRCIDEQQMFSF